MVSVMIDFLVKAPEINDCSWKETETNKSKSK